MRSQARPAEGRLIRQVSTARMPNRCMGEARAAPPIHVNHRRFSSSNAWHIFDACQAYLRIICVAMVR